MCVCVPLTSFLSSGKKWESHRGTSNFNCLRAAALIVYDVCEVGRNRAATKTESSDVQPDYPFVNDNVQ